MTRAGTVEQRGGELVHLEGCPADPLRVESYPVARPERAGGGVAYVTRCEDCAAHVISLEPPTQPRSEG
jgi:hypothetical protein